jgi:hypothetical protein
MRNMAEHILTSVSDESERSASRSLCCTPPKRDFGNGAYSIGSRIDSGTDQDLVENRNAFVPAA